ncbi:MAG TPA: sigma-70 family RNA polymerase sigma factor [Cyclobacteriaceae bacterium]|nr:sigma-70 family RNA polymerase sigma factor [Cyclobacteriaceae bacterium]
MLRTSPSAEFFHSELLGYVMKIVKNKPLSEDIVQDVFVKVQTKSQQLRDEEKVKGWIYQITRNTIIDHYRHESKEVSWSGIDWLEGEQFNYNECVARYIGTLLPQLPELYREALKLTELENLSQVEVAERLGISYSGAKSRIQRGRQWLKSEIERTLFVETDSYGNIVTCKNKLPCC